MSTFSVVCPCCGAELVVDAETQSVIHHVEAKSATPITDLTAEVKRLQNAGAEREKAFQKSLAAERTREVQLDKKFDELLRRAKQTPAGRPLKDIDL